MHSSVVQHLGHGIRISKEWYYTALRAEAHRGVPPGLWEELSEPQLSQVRVALIARVTLYLNEYRGFPPRLVAGIRSVRLSENLEMRRLLTLLVDLSPDSGVREDFEDQNR